MSKFLILTNFQSSNIVSDQNPRYSVSLSCTAKSKEISDEKIPGQGRLTQEFPGVSSSILVIIIYSSHHQGSGRSSTCPRSITCNSERQLINQFFSFVFQPPEELVVTVFVFHAGTSVSGK